MTAELPDLPLADGSVVVCEVRLRRLPGRREVFAGNRAGEAVVAKVYLDPRRAGVHARREAAGLEAFAAAGVAAPELLYHGRDDAGRPVVVVRHVAGAEGLKARWETADRRHRESLLRGMMVMLAAHHAAGLCQNDLHPGNFLIADERIYSIDGDAVEARRGPLGHRRSLRNLALFCAQFLPDIEALSLEASADYAIARGWSVTQLRDRLPGLIAAARLRRWRRYRDKLYRECSDIAYRRTTAGSCFVVRAQADRLSGLLQNPDVSCPADPAQRVKNGNTATVWRTDVDGLSVVVKRYNVKNRLHGARMLAKEGRASASWRSAHMLAFFGIATPAPLALIRGRRTLAGQRSYLVSAELAGDSLADWLCRHRDNRMAVHDMAAQIGALFARLAALRIVHGDTKATNFLVAGGRVQLIDLDAMKVYTNPVAFARAWRRDTRRFLANWRDDPEILEPMQAAVADSSLTGAPGLRSIR
jgi:tRNA A-37 threonylcarbamoyl transferase component Bud32